MTAKEKAMELVEQFYKWTATQRDDENEWFKAKQCALICVYEMLKIFDDTNGFDYRLNYWQEVKQEIELLKQ